MDSGRHASLMQEPDPVPRKALRSQLRLLVTVMVGFDLLVVVLAAWTLLHSRHNYQEQAEATTHNLALVLEQSLLANVRQIDLALQSVRDEAERTDIQPGSRGIESHVQAQFARVPLLESLRTTDAEGVPESIGGLPESHAHGFSDRDWFQRLRTSPQAGLVISRPSRDGAGQAWVITLARRLETPQRTFRGTVYAHVRLDRLTRELAQVDVGRHGSISLRGADLELLARYPAYPGQETAIGDTTISGDYREAVNSGQELRRFTAESVIDHQVRTYILRKLTQPTFFIQVGLSQTEYLASWRQEALLSSLAVAGLLALSIAMVWMGRSAWRRQLASQAERDRLIQELTQALAEVKTLAGMLPICGHCKKIRDDQGYWNHLETYLSHHSDATFTHGVCPDCSQALREEFKARSKPPAGP